MKQLMKRRSIQILGQEAYRAQEGAYEMICPDSDLDCDNPGCRRGGCQGRRPKLPLFRAYFISVAQSLPLLEPEIPGGTTALKTADRSEESAQRGRFVAA
jgi:hypothetical protein